LRAQVSGVSLNDQATNLMQFQQAYEASAQMINVINTTMQYLMDTVTNI
jgi:flagellar hook-associated protein 1 FlgK